MGPTNVLVPPDASVSAVPRGGRTGEARDPRRRRLHDVLPVVLLYPDREAAEQAAGHPWAPTCRGTTTSRIRPRAGVAPWARRRLWMHRLPRCLLRLRFMSCWERRGARGQPSSPPAPSQTKGGGWICPRR